MLGLLSSVALSFSSSPCVTEPPAGSAPWDKLVHMLSISDHGIRVFISDLSLPEYASPPQHFHEGQEFVYIAEGQGILQEEGKEPWLNVQGDAYEYLPGVSHQPIAGPGGARALTVIMTPVDLSPLEDDHFHNEERDPFRKRIYTYGDWLDDYPNATFLDELPEVNIPDGWMTLVSKPLSYDLDFQAEIATLKLAPGAVWVGTSAAAEELVYVFEGSATVSLNGVQCPVTVGGAGFAVLPGVEYQLTGGSSGATAFVFRVSKYRSKVCA